MPSLCRKVPCPVAVDWKPSSKEGMYLVWLLAASGLVHCPMKCLLVQFRNIVDNKTIAYNEENKYIWSASLQQISTREKKSRVVFLHVLTCHLPCLCNTDGLLLHCLMDTGSVMFFDTIELVYATEASICKHQCSSFQIPLPKFLHSSHCQTWRIKYFSQSLP